MIKNDHQLNLTKKRFKELEEHLEHLKRQYLDQNEYEFYSEATCDQIDAMKREIDDYKTAKAGSVDSLLSLWMERGAIAPTTKEQLSLGEFIALLRIARGLTQEELALRLNLKQSHVARFEQRAYKGYAVETLSRIFQELGVKLSLEPIKQQKAG